MELTKREKLLALALGLHLLGLEIEASRERLEGMFQRGTELSAEETVAESQAFSRLAKKFTQLEEQYLELAGQNSEGAS